VPRIAAPQYPALFQSKHLPGVAMTKQLMIGIATLLALSGAAAAADLPTRKGPPPPPPPPIFTWTGFYLGADVGGAWALDRVSPTIADGGTFPRHNTLSPGGIFGGATIGYNYQIGNIVLGAEGDGGYMNIQKSKPDVLGGTEVDHLQSGAYGDITGRLGYSFFDRALVYAKGGFAVYGGEAHTTTGIAGFTVNDTGTFTGWTIGGGLEYKIDAAWSIKGEYQYFNFGSQNATLTGAPGVFPYKNELSINTVKFGINYKFF
jgi:outer membrane immunogenic protein